MNLKPILCVVALVVLLASSAQAQIEPIGPLTLGPGQSADLVFTNLLPPDPDFKELQFVGNADTLAGAVGDLLIQFDYVDQQGQTIVVPAPISQFLVIGGQPNPLDTGILLLPFCPQVVSLHLTNVGNASSVPIDVTGSFRHECMPVPEPRSLVLAGFGAVGLCLVGRKFRRRK
jgi:PEP-CTERM motif